MFIRARTMRTSFVGLRTCRLSGRHCGSSGRPPLDRTAGPHGPTGYGPSRGPGVLIPQGRMAPSISPRCQYADGPEETARKETDDESDTRSHSTDPSRFGDAELALGSAGRCRGDRRRRPPRAGSGPTDRRLAEPAQSSGLLADRPRGLPLWLARRSRDRGVRSLPAGAPPDPRGSRWGCRKA